ncbi:spore coat protein D [Bacillus mesophilus]|uniref:Spore coat protein CotH n=1 Tax=Bacillus mesophilus TaxID=1808955 RepID=A0A6M0QAF2_9BACI|nr:CotD family spore coat protein [Bacillus mesophilus]MBM7662650.1 spore coat protein D [Bacillus mesophilus]NEY73285.1 spore coat protein CotH [Bacillus mesophilus]
MAFFRRPCPRIYPPKVNAVNTANVIEVPHIHPSHTIYNHHQKFVHKHYYPHTTSAQNFVTHEHVHVPGPGPVLPPRRPFF